MNSGSEDDCLITGRRGLLAPVSCFTSSVLTAVVDIAPAVSVLMSFLSISGLEVSLSIVFRLIATVSGIVWGSIFIGVGAGVDVGVRDAVVAVGGFVG